MRHKLFLLTIISTLILFGCGGKGSSNQVIIMMIMAIKMGHIVQKSIIIITRQEQGQPIP